MCLNSRRNDQTPKVKEFAMQNIIKFCADHLRSLSINQGVKLKSGHAHEIVAAFFGYKSKAALYADTQYPITNLPQADVIVLIPSAPIDKRRENLEDFPSILPDSNTLVEEVFTRLVYEKVIVATKIWTSYDLKRQALLLAHEYQQDNQLLKLYHTPSHEEVEVEITHEGIRFTVTPYHKVAGYPVDGSGRNQTTSLLTTIWLKRIAGHIGYAKPEINARPIPMLVKVQS